MNGIPILKTQRPRLRAWRDDDRAPFAAFNADSRVMEFLPKPLDRDESDAMADRIAAHFAEHRVGLWAVEVPGIAPFIGFVGLAVAKFDAPFTPCIEIGWRLAFNHWEQGYASEAARATIEDGFGRLGLRETVSFTVPRNLRSRAVMERIGMRRDPADDFDHPNFAEDHPLRRHALYRLGR